MATQKFSPLTLVLIAVALSSHISGQNTTGFRPSENAFTQQTLPSVTLGKHPLTPPGKPAPDNSSSSGSTT
jgi:hypothetical protein